MINGWITKTRQTIALQDIGGRPRNWDVTATDVILKWLKEKNNGPHPANDKEVDEKLTLEKYHSLDRHNKRVALSDVTFTRYSKRRFLLTTVCRKGKRL